MRAAASVPSDSCPPGDTVSAPPETSSVSFSAPARAASSEVQHGLPEQRLRARDELRLGRIALLDLEQLADAVADEPERSLHGRRQVGSRRLARPPGARSRAGCRG